MRDTKKVLAVLLILSLITACCSVCFAAAKATYRADGSVESITTDKGTITYYANGNVDTITTPTGSAYYYSNGNLDRVDGTPSISLAEAKAELENLKKSNQTPNTTTPKDEPEKDSSEDMPETGVIDYVFLPIVLFAGLAIFFGVKYNSMRKV